MRKAVKQNFEVQPVPEVNNENWQGRLEDMDREGVDVALIFPATFSTASTVLDVEMQNELYAAYHRYLDAYCGERPDRLKAAALMNAHDPQWSAAELRSLADKPWLAAVEVLLPEDMPIDDPALAPIFEAMDDCDVPFVHHSFFYEPPYFPGIATSGATWRSPAWRRTRGARNGCSPTSRSAACSTATRRCGSVSPSVPGAGSAAGSIA